MPLSKRAAAEFFGTFWLVFGGCGSAVLAAGVHLGIGYVGVAFAFGLTVLTMAFAIGHVSGCHLNPAVSIGLVTAKRFPASELPAYIIAQLLGAICASGVLYLIASGNSTFSLAGGFASNGYADHSPEHYSLVACFLTVFRLGAGWHGLGSRGVLTVVAGSLMLALTLGYAELLRRYGTESLVNQLDEAVRWSHHHLGAFPRPIVALLGVPALTWGTHMRARRRQGWWVCAFGVALTAPVAYALIDPGRSVREATLATAYGAVIGFAIGYVLIRLDLRLTGPRPTGPRGRRLVETEEATAVRPEPGRTYALW